MFAQKSKRFVTLIDGRDIIGMTEETTALVLLFQKGDRKAFTKLVKIFRQRVYGLAFKMLKNHIDADEVAQETFVRVYKRIGQLKSPVHFDSFIYRIASNYAIDLIRKRKGRIVAMPEESELPGSVQLTLATKVTSPEKVLENKQLLQAIVKAAEELPPRQQTTLILHDIEGLSKEEVARIMNCPEATVRSNLHIARNKLKKKLAKLLTS
ncbi:MAG: sigma-70 family RNA polymerase sigma factor [candidate division Zixibacteria bacterium]|nr:sigma-70 family RNA polymerase sigma factor [candidate division Zixibacteria bacterium]